MFHFLKQYGAFILLISLGLGFYSVTGLKEYWNKRLQLPVSVLQPLEILESATTGSIIGSVTDQSQAIDSIRIISGNIGGYFEIDHQTKQVRLIRPLSRNSFSKLDLVLKVWGKGIGGTEINILKIPIEVVEDPNLVAKRFVASFEQLFFPSQYWLWSYTHVYKEGRPIESHQHKRGFGPWGKSLFTYAHFYDLNSQIAYSIRESRLGDSQPVKIYYELDPNGRIKSYTTELNEVIQERSDVYYNDRGLVIRQRSGSNGMETIYDYKYDGLNKLTELVIDSTDFYSYEVKGDRLMAEHMRSMNEVGKVTDQTSVFYSYDSLDRLILIEDAGSGFLETYGYAEAEMVKRSYIDDQLSYVVVVDSSQSKVKQGANLIPQRNKSLVAKPSLKDVLLN